MNPQSVTTNRAAAVPPGEPLTYPARLQHDSRWALSEGSRYFGGNSAVQDTLRKITRRLDELGIPYAVSGGLALFAHGYRRFTEDVDILVTPEGLQRAHDELEGLGYLRTFPGSKNLRDADSRVTIEFLVTGQYPGDGRPKPVAFPNPAAVAVQKDGIKYLTLPTLVELKLASGMTEPTRLKDLSDVIELIRLLDLPEAFSTQLSPFVADKYLELWRSLRQARTRFVAVWKSERLSPEMKGIDELIPAFPDSAQLLQSMSADGVVLDRISGDSAVLVTTDPGIAGKYGMHDERELWDKPE